MLFRKLRTSRRGFWVFLCLVLTMVMGMAPGVSWAAGPGPGSRAMMQRPGNPHHGMPGYRGHRPAHRPGLFMGTVQDTDENNLTVEVSLPGFSRHYTPMSREIMLQVDADTVVFSQDLEVMLPADLAIDSTVTVAARSVWGVPVAKLLYDGTTHDLSKHSYRGRLVEDQGEQLLLEAPWGEELTIVLDGATIWVDGGSMEPPTELQVGLPLQVLGTMQDDGTVLAALVTSGTMHW